VTDFIDLEGVSGARYRFRLWPEGAAHIPTGGNFAFVRMDAAQFTVLSVGETNDLSTVRSAWSEARRLGATHVFTRLNVARAVRRAEHEDIAARYPGGA
jgi:hypothetical protein